MRLNVPYRIATRALIIVLFWVSACTNAHAQNLSSDELYFHHLTPDDGLSQVSANTLLKDKRGYIWVGTQDGLNRYNGQYFSVFKYNPLDTSTISGNYINALFEDDQGRLWVGTRNNGVCVYYPKEDLFIRLALSSESESPNTMVSSIVQSPDKSIWIGTRNQGLFKIENLEEFTFKHKRVAIRPKNLSAIYSMKIWEEEKLLIGCNDQVLIGSIDGDSILTKPLSISGLKGSVNTFVNDENRNLWIGSNVGLWHYDLSENKSRIQNLENPLSGDSGNIYEINQIQLDNQSRLWIASRQGLFVLSDWKDEEKRFARTLNFTHDPFNDQSLSHNSVLAILIDTTISFIGTSKFLNVHLKKNKFSTVSRSLLPGNSINNNIVFSFYKDSTNSDLWIGTSGGGLNLRRDDNYYYFTESDNKNSISNNIVRGIKKGPDSILWLATTKGISVIDLNTFNPDKPAFISYVSDLSTDDELHHNNLRDVLVNDDQVWFITYGGGLSRFTGDLSQKKFSFQTYRHDPNSLNSINSDNIHCIVSGSQINTFWMGTDNGLCLLKFDDGDYSRPQIKRYMHVPKDEQTISSNSIHDIIIDNDDILWIGTRYGLNRFDPKTEITRRYGPEKGIIDPVVYIVQEDDHNNIWLGTNNGISRFNKSSELFYNYKEEEGLQDREFNIKSKFKDEKGLIYLGGVGGFNIIDPTAFMINPEPLPIYLENIIIEDESDFDNKIPFKRNHNNISTSIDYKNFPLRIMFAAPDGDPTRLIEYEYLLEPQRSTWNALGAQNSLLFPDLSPGKYTLHIRGIEGGIPWNNSPLKIQLEVIPPWWKSRSAYLIYLIMLGTIVFALYRFQLQRNLAQQEVQKFRELDNVKSKLYTNITHEFRTPLTVIMGLAQSLRSSISEIGKQKEIKKLDLIERNGNNLLNLINQMLDLASLEQGNIKPNYKQADIIKFLEIALESFHSAARSKSISLTFYNEVPTCIMDFDEKKLLQIISNLVGNAVKFCRPGDKIVFHVNKNLTEGQERLVIKIKDTGPGIAADHLPNLFDRFYQVDDTHTRRGEGTGIGLAVTKEIVDLLEGDLEVASRPNKGTVFTVSLPIKHLSPLDGEDISTSPQDKSIISHKPSTIDSDARYSEDLPSVLIVEDNSDVAFYIRQCLDEQYNVFHAADGKLGIEHAHENIPDIIISDIMMPEVDGFELCERLKGDPITNHIPIILLTAKTKQEDKITGLSKGADAYLSKPFNKEELLVRVNKLIELRQSLKEKYASTISTNNLQDGLSKMAKKPLDKNQQFLAEVIELIVQHMSDNNFKSALLSRKLGMSESQLYRKLKAISGKSTALFIRSIRLKKARELLLSGMLNVSEVAYECGFTDPSWFSRVYKETFGESPVESKSS